MAASESAVSTARSGGKQEEEEEERRTTNQASGDGVGRGGGVAALCRHGAGTLSRELEPCEQLESGRRAPARAPSLSGRLASSLASPPQGFEPAPSWHLSQRALHRLPHFGAEPLARQLAPVQP